ncbi:lysophospholipid acyltransferase family protein [Candidatus Albibeggiatoa sp. nov. NOAA]|uniref:lysophospholipid acyltransferase family protein n=1 Tax=Candidatus Albibeggiatoa sp. nov. NOAA TaxID=3162724 RepID=UPI003300C565|nr:1-acyl-sn-glycerol-3-phosphate acyltransferase [Thiotrichaceae bacterium]
MQTVRTLFFYLGFYLLVLIFSPLVLLSIPLPYPYRYALVKVWAHGVLGWLKLTCGLSYEVHGAENIPDVPSAIVLSKHQAAWETIAFLTVFPPQIWVLKRELLKIPIYGWALGSLKPVAIDRKNIRQSLRDIIKQGKERLSEGHWIIIFPEGTRVLPKQAGRYTPSGGLLAAEAVVPVVPVAHNAGSFWRRTSFVKRAGVIQIRIGEVIQTEGKTAQEITKQAEVWIEQTMQTLPEHP